MKKFTICLLVIFSFSAHAKELQIVSEYDWKPYVINTDGNVSGFSIEVISNVFKTMDITFKLKPYPWKRAIKMVMDGEVDALFNASKKADREEKCYYPDEPLFDSIYVFFISKENEGKLKYDIFEDLKAYKIGVSAGYAYTTEFWSFLESNSNYYQAKNDAQNFKKLKSNRIQFFPADMGNGMVLVKEMNLKNEITYLPKPLVQKPYYIIFNKQKVEKSFVDAFGQALKAFKTSPEYMAIYEKYLK